MGAACADGKGTEPPPSPPAVTQVRVDANQYNALSTVVTFVCERCDSVRVRYESGDGITGATPFVQAGASAGRIVVLGLRPRSSYAFAVEAQGGGGAARSASVTASTGELPASIRALRLTGTGAPSSGYTLVVPLGPPTAATTAVVAFDSSGGIAWYREFTGEGWAVEAKQQTNGNITVYLGRSYGWQNDHGRFVEVTPSGDVLRSFAVASPYLTDPHELLLTGGGREVTAVHLLGYELRHFDLTAVGGAADTVLAVHTIERQNALGATEFRWNSGDLYSPADWPALNVLTGDVVHPSSLAIDTDSDYVLSLQAMDEIIKIDKASGATMWRFGGRHNEFTLQGDPLGGFQGQHSVRVLLNGHVLLMDNRVRSRPPQSRAVEYEVDASAHVARLVWQYAPDPPIASPIMGSVERLTNGNTVVGFGAAGRVDEVSASGLPVWRVSLSADGGSTTIPFYRAIRIASLYRFVAP
jgi:arylsulfotransferase ASST